MTHSVIINNVTKKYKMYNKTSEKLMDIIIPGGYGEDFYALQNITFTANKGDVIGVIGVNGAGKSTLSNLIAGITPATAGEIEIKGQVSLIAIASGLNNELSGRDNIELKCLMLGFNKKEINKLMPSIIEFADIGKFIDQPVKKYSSGMRSRLGFAISVNINPDVLVIDEALSVGDRNFADKCLDKMNEFKEKGKTIFFISHSIGQVKKFCQKALWLEAGELKAYGDINEVVPQYEKFLKEFKAMSKEDQKNFKQLVLEKRSKLNEQGEKLVNLSSKVNSGSQQKNTKRKRGSFSRKAKKIVFVLLFLTAISIGIAYIQKDNDITKKMPTTETAITNTPANEGTKNIETGMKEIDKTVIKSDIRYVNVPSAFIRTEPNLESEALDMASFGQAFLVQEIQHDSSSDIEWLKIEGNQFKDEGWISSNIMSVISEELNDESVITKIDHLTDFNPPLIDMIHVIGNNKETSQLFEIIDYTYEYDKVTGFTVQTNNLLELEVINELGEPQLKQQDTLLYHGSNYDYVFKLLLDGKVSKLSIFEK